MVVSEPFIIRGVNQNLSIKLYSNSTLFSDRLFFYGHECNYGIKIVNLALNVKNLVTTQNYIF